MFDYIVISFFISSEEAMKNLRRLWNQRSKGHDAVFQQETDLSISHDDFGGQIWLLDPLELSKGLVKRLDVPLAFGMALLTKTKELVCTSGDSLSAIKDGVVKKNFLTNNLFNDLHTVQFNSAGNLLVASTGIDALLEINPDTNELVWFWAAGEQGFSKSGRLEPFEVNKDYRLISKSTPDHCTHINSAIDLGDGTVLATLFHQGLLIRIHKHSKNHVVLLSGMRQPHSIRRLSRGFSVCDTQSQEVILLDEKFDVTHRIRGDFSWIQDAIPLENTDEWVICDSNNHRLVRVSVTGKELDELRWAPDSRKPSCILGINKIEAQGIFGVLP